ncbi:MAG: PAS domain S-box protein, partial [Steroidobacteraceae bacterium]
MNLLQGALDISGIIGLAIGILLVAVPALVILRRDRARSLARNRELAATNRRNQAIVEGSGEGVLELDNSGLVRYANPAAAKLLGYDMDELAGLDYRVLINTQEDGDNRTDPVRRVRYTTDIMRGVGALLRRKDGQYRPVEYKIVPVTEQGMTVGTVLVFRDVGERVRLDNLIRDMQTTARIGGWEFEAPSQKIHWTDVIYTIHDLPVGQPIDWDMSRNMFHPEDQ